MSKNKNFITFSKTTLAISLVFFTISCAVNPESIAPAYVSPMLYRDFNCDQLQAEYARVGHALNTVSAQQRKARSSDVAGVFFLGIPVSSSSGTNVADQVASLKGEKRTIEQVAVKNACDVKEEETETEDKAEDKKETKTEK